MSSPPLSSLVEVKLEEGIVPFSPSSKVKICFQCGLPEPGKGRTPKSILPWQLCQCQSWDCKQCNMRLTSRASFRGHVTTQHPSYLITSLSSTPTTPSSNGHRCPTCSSVFGSPAFLSAHQKVAHAQKSQFCQFCHKTDFDTVMGLYNHMLKGCPEKEKFYERKRGVYGRDKHEKTNAIVHRTNRQETPILPVKEEDLGVDPCNIPSTIDAPKMSDPQQTPSQRPAKRPRKEAHKPITGYTVPMPKCKFCQQEYLTPRELYTHLLDGCSERGLRKKNPVLSRPTSSKLNQKVSSCKYCKVQFRTLSKYYYHLLKGCQAKDGFLAALEEESSPEAASLQVPAQNISIPVALGEALLQDELITADMLCTVHLRLKKFKQRMECPFCPAEFHFRESLDSHLKRQHGRAFAPSTRVAVDLLPGASDAVDLAYETFQSCNGGEKEVKTKCPSCNLFFLHLPLLIEHFDRESEQEGLICEPCKDSGRNIGSLPHPSAMEQHRSSGHVLMGLFETKLCRYCPDIFPTGLKYDKHILAVHPDRVPTKVEVKTEMQEEEDNVELPLDVCIKVEPVSDQEME